MGTLLDTSVLVRIERAGGTWALPPDEEVGIAAITASELLHGVHRADPIRRVQRQAFVENILRTVPTVPFDLQVARTHAWLWADLAAQGQVIGPHDLLVAATALALGWSVATHNPAEFRRVPGLLVREPGPSGPDG